MRRHGTLLAATCALAVFTATDGGPTFAGEPAKFIPLFDGKTFAGWHKQGGGEWTIDKDGTLVGRHERKEPRHGHLITNKVYKDFTIRFSYRSIKGNSGFYFRVDEVGGNVGVHGFQAEIDPTASPGGLYETGGRGWVAQPSAEFAKKHFKPGQWNEMTVSARGRHIVVHVNGHRSAELKDDPGRLQGHIALQLHGGADVEVHFKDIVILTGFVEGTPKPVKDKP